MLLKNISFPLYKLRKYDEIYSTPLGIKKIRTYFDEYILDDPSLPGDYEERRIRLIQRYGKKKVYKLTERVDLLRQLVKYKSGSKFINLKGEIYEYRKSSKLYPVISVPIIKIDEHGDNWSVLTLKHEHQKFLVGFDVERKNIKYASLMITEYGPFLYDLTKEPHDSYKRKI